MYCNEHYCQPHNNSIKAPLVIVQHQMSKDLFIHDYFLELLPLNTFFKNYFY